MTPLEAAARNMARQHYYRIGHQPCSQVEAWVDNEWRDHVDDARAVIDALREPSKGMLEAGGEEERWDGKFRSSPESEENAKSIWSTMISAALAEG